MRHITDNNGAGMATVVGCMDSYPHRRTGFSHRQCRHGKEAFSIKITAGENSFYSGKRVLDLPAPSGERRS